MRVTLVASPLANLTSITSALEAAGASVTTTADPSEIAAARRVVLPGVGSFAAGMHWLEETGAGAALHAAIASGASLLGICLGHQLLFEGSPEMGLTRGLGVLDGEVVRLETPLPVPQVGWNRVHRHGGSATDGFDLLDGVPDGTPFYFVHSFAVQEAPDAIAEAAYGARFTAAVRRGRICGVQFHPEKSSAAGLRVLRNFVSWS